MSALSHITGGVLLAGLGVCLATTGAAQGQQADPSEAHFRFERLVGLSHNTVLSIVQDRYGYLWIGTTDGLNRYDGYEFTVYRHDPVDSTSLSSNNVTALLEDRAGHLWVGTEDGLNRFDRKAERFVRYPLASDSLTSHRQGVSSLLEDDAGRLWVGGVGLYRYDPGSGQFRAYRHEPGNPNSLSQNAVWRFYQGRSGRLWVSTGDGVLHAYDPEADHFLRHGLSQAGNFITMLYEDEGGRLWIADENGRARAFEPASGRLTPIPELPPDQGVILVHEDRDRVRWIGTTGGLYRYDPATRSHLLLRPDPSLGAYLPNYVRALYEDRAGALWVGTLSGLFHLDPHAKPFAHLGHDPTDPNSLGSNTVMAVWEDRDEVLWLGTLGGGLNRVDRRTGTVVRYRRRAGDPVSLCHDLVWALYQDRRGVLWIGTNEGLCALDRRSERFTRYTLPLGSAGSIQPSVQAIREDQAGRLWIASKIGLYRLYPQTGAVKWFARPGSDQGGSAVDDSFLQSLYVDRAGFLWMGTFGGGLYRLDTETDVFTRSPLVLTRQKELVSEGIWAFHEDDDGALWLGSDLGLTRFHPQTGALVHYAQRDGLPGSIVYAILEDNLGRLWLSTNLGLVRFDDRLPDGQQFRTYGAGDGLKNTEFNRRAGFKNRRGELFFGGLEGLTAFVPAQIRDNPYVPPVVLTRIQTSNRDTTVSVNPFGLDRLVLSYRDYSVSFEFAALSFTNPTQNQYAYRLEGFDGAWVQPGTRRFARYTNLPPGDYVFRVKGSNDDGLWNEEGVALALTVTPPFWLTWWFRLLVAAAVIGLLTAAYRYRVARLIEVERMRLRIAGDLHDDIGSRLSSIALMSEMVREHVDLPPGEAHRLAQVSKAARELVGALRDVVWFVSPDHDRLDDLAERMRETAGTMLHGTDCSFVGAEKGLPDALSMAFRHNVFLIYKEALHNIVRHARASRVAIRLGTARGTLVLTVADDGVGFDPAAPGSGHGLKSMKHRAEQIGGTLLVESEPGKGTTITLSVAVK